MDAEIYENRIKWLKRDLYHSELEITRLNKEREVSKQEISDLKSKLSTLVRKIKHLHQGNFSRRKAPAGIESSINSYIILILLSIPAGALRLEKFPDVVYGPPVFKGNPGE